MFNAFKHLFGVGETETHQQTTRELAALSEEERDRRLDEGRSKLIKEYKLKNKPIDVVNGRVGLENLGNTCFMGSALQCLSNTKPLTDYFLQTSWESQLNTLSAPVKGRLACEYFALLKKMWCESGDETSPSNIKKAIQKVNKNFAGYAQQDSQEFLSYFLDALHEDLNNVIVKPYEPMQDFSGQSITNYANDQFNLHLRRNSSFVVDLFHGQFYSHIQCPECRFESVTCDPFDILSLNIPSREKRQVEGYLVPFSYGDPIQNFKFQCFDSEELSNVLNHIFASASTAKQETFRPMFYLRSKIVEHLPPGLKISIGSVMDNPALLFICQVIDEKITRLTFGERADALIENPTPAEERTLRIFIFEKDEQIGIEREVLVPDSITAQDLYVLLYLIHRAAFLGAGLTDPAPALANEMPATREQIMEELEFFWPNGKTDGSRSLFIASVEKKEIHKLDPEHRLFQQTFKDSLRIELNLSPKRIKAPLKLKKCFKLDIDPLLPTMEKEISLFDCLESFTQEERLDQENMWYCSRCKDHKQAFKKMALHRLPKILVVHLKRFKKEIVRSEWVSYRKNTTRVEAPLHDLDLSRFTIDNDEKCTYDLFAVSNHFGNCGGGHYTAFCKNPLRKQWYVFDDENVRPIDEHKVITEAAYVLFYQKK